MITWKTGTFAAGKQGQRRTSRTNSIKKGFLLLLAVLLSGLMMGARAEEKAVRTVMVYMVGSDLEERFSAASRDLKEMVQSGADPERVNVVFALGGCRGWTIVPLYDGEMRVGALKSGGQVDWLDAAQQRDMAQPETLRYFIDTAMAACPAEHIDLILWDHGGGLYGYGRDSVSGNIMSVQDVAAALESCSVERFEAIVFDACLMGSVEVAALLSPYCDYYVASEETMPATGLDYGFLGLESACGEETEPLLRDVCARYAASVKKDVPYSLAVLRTERVPAVCEALDAFVAAGCARLREGADAYFLRGAEQSAAFSRWSSTVVMDLYDLGTFARQADETEAASLAEAVRQTVVCNVTNIEGATGLSFYCPAESAQAERTFCRGYYQTLAQRGLLTVYGAWLEDREQSLAAPLSVPAGRVQSAKPGADGTVYSMQLTAEEEARFVRGYYVILREAEDDPNVWQLIEGCRDVRLENGILSAQRDRGIFVFAASEGETGDAVTLIERSRGDGNVYYWFEVLLLRFEEDFTLTQERMEGQLLVSDEYPGGRVCELVPVTTQTLLAPRTLWSLQAGDYLQTVFAEKQKGDDPTVPFNLLMPRSDGVLNGTELAVGDAGTLYTRRTAPDAEQKYYVQLNAVLSDSSVIASAPMPLSASEE